MTDWRFTKPRWHPAGQVSTTDIDLFGRRLRLGESAEATDVDRIERACDRITKEAPILGNVRQTALRVLRYLVVAVPSPSKPVSS